MLFIAAALRRDLLHHRASKHHLHRHQSGDGQEHRSHKPADPRMVVRERHRCTLIQLFSSFCHAHADIFIVEAATAAKFTGATTQPVALTRGAADHRPHFIAPRWL